ncbi:MAG: nuclear transport factor 2 family protein [Nitrospira sp.]|nr:nuclear transport factor 2 family protein [Nitrospira sp.]
MQSVVERFTQTYGRLNAQSLGLLSDLHSDDREFQDPFHHLTGLSALRQYFEQLYARWSSVPSRSRRRWDKAIARY